MGSSVSRLLRGFRLGYRILRHEGFRALGISLLSESVFRRVRLYELDIQTAPVEQVAHRQWSIDFLRSETINGYLELRPDSLRHEVLDRFRQGHECVTIRAAGQPVHACWIGRGRVWVAYLSVWLDLKPDQIYVYDSYTAPAWRGKNLPLLRRQFLSRHLATAGYAKLIAVAVPENKPAVRAIQKGGYEETGTLGCVRIMGWRIPFFISLRAKAQKVEDTASPR